MHVFECIIQLKTDILGCFVSKRMEYENEGENRKLFYTLPVVNLTAKCMMVESHFISCIFRYRMIRIVPEYVIMSFETAH